MKQFFYGKDIFANNVAKVATFWIGLPLVLLYNYVLSYYLNQRMAFLSTVHVSMFVLLQGHSHRLWKFVKGWKFYVPTNTDQSAKTCKPVKIEMISHNQYSKTSDFDFFKSYVCDRKMIDDIKYVWRWLSSYKSFHRYIMSILVLCRQKENKFLTFTKMTFHNKH